MKRYANLTNTPAADADQGIDTGYNFLFRGSTMMKRILPLLLLVAMAALISPNSAQAQPVISDADTFRVVNTQGAPGTVVPIKLHIANRSATLLALNRIRYH